MVNISIGTALLSAILGYAVVFLGIVFLMAVILFMGRTMKKSSAKEVQAAQAKAAPRIVASGIDSGKVAAIVAAIEEYEREA